MPDAETDMTTEDWVRFLAWQADHTRPHRHTLYQKADLTTRERVLDVGCGTGVITAEIASLTPGHVIGIDIDSQKLQYARKAVPARVTLLEADALALPFRDETFDMVTFSVVLMHITEQQRAVNEMARVTRRGGVVLATTEPDHAACLSYPENEAHPFFMKTLTEKGSDTQMGRKLKYLFVTAGLQTEVGIDTEDLDILKSTQESLAHFTHYFENTKRSLRKHGWTEAQIEEYERKQVQLIERNMHFSFLPVFYAIGRKV